MTVIKRNKLNFYCRFNLTLFIAVITICNGFAQKECKALETRYNKLLQEWDRTNIKNTNLEIKNGILLTDWDNVSRENTDYMRKNQGLREQIESLKRGNAATKPTNSVKDKEIERLTAEAERLRKEINKNALPTDERDKLKGLISKLDISNKKIEKDKRDLTTDKAKLEREKEKQKNTIDSLKVLSAKLQNDLNVANDELEKLRKAHKKLQEDYTDIKNKYDELYGCLTAFCDTVQKQLADANAAYELYKEFKTRDTARKKAYFNEAWAIYKSIYYDNIPNSICFLAKKDCLGKNPQACTNISNILVFNRENIVEELGNTLTEQLNRRTEMILSSLSLVIRDGNDTGRTEALRNLESLPRVLFQEKSSTTEGGKELLKDIKNDYEKGLFSSSLSKFDRLYYLLEMKEFQKIGDAVLEAKYCAGIILLWELADMKAINSWVIPASWLKNNDNTANGILLLNEVLEKTKNDKSGKYAKMQKKIKYALSKYPSLAK